MWALRNKTPFAAERSWVRDKNGAEVWLVAVKGTFDIEPDGTLHLAKEQEPVNIAPELREEGANPSLLHDTDLPHRKNSTDVLIEGHAYAPKGQPTGTMKVGLRLAGINKVLQVTGDRVWEKALGRLSLSAPRPFLKMPLTYERAFGGTDQMSENPRHHGWVRENPAGCGFATREDHLEGRPAPNIEDPNALVQRWKDRPAPAGFAPIAGHWFPRVELAGTYDETWEKARQPLLAEDFDEGYYQSAPADQQVAGHLKGGERVQLFNLTPGGRLQFHLPRLSLAFKTVFDDGPAERHRAVMHTVTIEPDHPRVVVVWHTHLECHHRVQKLSHTTIRLKDRILISAANRAKEVVLQ